MRNKFVLIMASDFQTICAFEFLKKNKINNCFVLKLNNKIDLDSLSNIYGIDYKLISLSRLLLFFFSNKYSLVFGNDRGYLFKLLRSTNLFKTIYMVNDGHSDLLDNHQKEKYHYSLFRKLLLKSAIIFGKSMIKSKINYFTFNFKKSYKYHEFNQFAFIKKLLSNINNEKASFHGKFYIGQPLSESNLTTLQSELDFIKKSFKKYSIDFYVSHPRDSFKKLNYLKNVTGAKAARIEEKR